MTGEWLAPILAFLGGALGAGLAFTAARRDTIAQQAASANDLRQRELASAREEWGRRFTTALADLNADESFRRRELGRILLVELASSDLATPEERDLAETLLAADARLDARGEVVHLLPRGIIVDDVVVVEDDEDEPERSRP